MAFIYLPVAFVYVLPAAIFFWLSKDVFVSIAKSLKNIFLKVMSKISSKEEKPSDKPVAVESADNETPADNEIPADNETPSDNEAPADDKPQADVSEADEKPVGAEATDIKLVGEQMTIDETIAQKADDKESVTEVAGKEESTVKEEPAADQTQNELPPEAETKKEESVAGWTATKAQASEDVTEKEPVDILVSVKKSFTSVVEKVKRLTPSGERFEKVIEDTGIGRDSRKSADNFFNQITDRVKLQRDFDAGDVIDDIKRQFDSLDMITTSAIAIMLSDTKTKAASPYIQSLKKPDIRVILLKFCQDTYFATDIEQLNKLFSKSYYKWKILRYLGKVTVFVKRGIGDSLPRRVAFRKARVTKNRFITKICETINTFESVKYISALSGNEEISDSKRNYKLDHLSENYKDALIYLVDLLLTCTCISKMLFVERMIKKMDPNSEFNKIITNMALSIDNHNLIISKSRPIYKQYYQSELGYINGDDLLYGMAITIMVNRVKKIAIRDTDILQINKESQNTLEFKQSMLKWLDGLSIHDSVEDVGTLILQKINLSIKGNYGMLTNALQELTNWENYYSQRVAYHKKERDRERYLKGDFEKEKEELIIVR